MGSFFWVVKMYLFVMWRKEREWGCVSPLSANGVGWKHIDVSGLLLTGALYFRKWPWAGSSWGQTCTWPEKGSFFPCSESLAPAILHDITGTKALPWSQWERGYILILLKGRFCMDYKQWVKDREGSVKTYGCSLFMITWLCVVLFVRISNIVL